SFLLPGLGQWVEGQPAYGGLYTGVALGGLVYSANVLVNDDLEGRREREQQLFEDAGKDYAPTNPAAESDIAERKFAYGTQLYQTMGGMSAYHAFRTAARSRQRLGQYEFLRHEETPWDVF